VRFLWWRVREDVFDAVRAMAAELRAELLADLEEGGGARLLPAPRDSAETPGSSVTVLGSELTAGAAMAAWRSRQYGELRMLLEYDEPRRGKWPMTSWLRRHPEDLRLLMRDALRLAPTNDEGRLSNASLGRAADTALRAIGYSLDTEARDFLVDCCRSFRHIRLRRTAMRVLAETWGGDPEATAALLENAERGPDPELRVVALRWLTKRCAPLPEVRELLYRCALADRDPAVRDHALRWMAQWWPDHPKYTALFVTDPRATNAPGPEQRVVMLQALAAGGQDAAHRAAAGSSRSRGPRHLPRAAADRPAAAPQGPGPSREHGLSGRNVPRRPTPSGTTRARRGFPRNWWRRRPRYPWQAEYSCPPVAAE
jgi:hypothetical protein